MRRSNGDHTEIARRSWRPRGDHGLSHLEVSTSGDAFARELISSDLAALMLSPNPAGLVLACAGDWLLRTAGQRLSVADACCGGRVGPGGCWGLGDSRTTGVCLGLE